MQENEKYFSQSLQDEFVDKVIFNKKRQGYFVEIGAHDGISFSNTYFLEKFRNFNGLCIEPNPNVYKRLVNNRNCQTKQVCISNKAGEVDFLLMEGSSEMLSGIYNEYHPDHMRRINNLKLENSAKKVIKV